MIKKIGNRFLPMKKRKPVLVPITIVVNSILMGGSMVAFESGGLTQAKEGYQSLGAL